MGQVAHRLIHHVTTPGHTRWKPIIIVITRRKGSQNRLAFWFRGEKGGLHWFDLSKPTRIYSICFLLTLGQVIRRINIQLDSANIDIVLIILSVIQMLLLLLPLHLHPRATAGQSPLSGAWIVTAHRHLVSTVFIHWFDLSKLLLLLLEHWGGVLRLLTLLQAMTFPLLLFYQSITLPSLIFNIRRFLKSACSTLNLVYSFAFCFSLFNFFVFFLGTSCSGSFSSIFLQIIHFCKLYFVKLILLN